MPFLPRAHQATLFLVHGVCKQMSDHIVLAEILVPSLMKGKVTYEETTSCILQRDERLLMDHLLGKGTFSVGILY